MGSPSHSGRVFRFGTFELDPETQQVRKAGLSLRLQPQPFKVLALLVSRAGKIVSREELRQELWGNETFVDFEQGLNYCIRQIRAVLGDEAQTPRYVETVPRRGYRFIAPVEGNGHSTRSASERNAVPEKKKTLGMHVWLILACTGLVLVLATVGYLARVRSSVHLTARDTIVVADFTNMTGDPRFDDTLKEATAIQLEQSPFLNILSQQRVAATLKLMSRPGQRLTLEVAREICLRANSKAVLTGSISLVGTHYLIVLRSINCQTGDTLAGAEAQAESPDKVLSALEGAGNQIRKELGESLASLNRFSKPLAQATTSSLEALKAYTQGDVGKQESLANFQRAVQLDPDFAAAYASMGTLYVNFSQTGLAGESFKKAFQLRDRVSERERFFIESSYYAVTTGQTELANQTYLQWAQEYPNDSSAYGNLGFNYIAIGNYEKALEATREALRVDHDNTIWTSNLMEAYLSLARLDEAKAVFNQAVAHGISNEEFGTSRYYLAFLQHDDAMMRKQLAWASSKPGLGGPMMSAEANTAAYYGRLAKAHDLSQRASDSATRNGEPESAAFYEATEALRRAEFGDKPSARRLASHALTLKAASSVRLAAALALARSGETPHSRKLADALDREFPVNTLIQAYWLPTIRAAGELDHGKPLRALELLESTAPYEQAQTMQFDLGTMYPVYLRGLAHLNAGHGEQAAAEFQKIFDHRCVTVNFPLASLAYLQFGRARALTRDNDSARKAYQNFFELWKDADPDVPILKQAKKEYAKLY